MPAPVWASPAESVGSSRPRRCRRDGAKDALGGALRSSRVVGDHNRELVAAEPEDLLVRADRAQEDAGDGREHLVARRVAESVVDLLEVVDVEEHEGDVGRLDQCVDVLVEGATVREPGQRVAACLGEGQRRPALEGERPAARSAASATTAASSSIPTFAGIATSNAPSLTPSPISGTASASPHGIPRR